MRFGRGTLPAALLLAVVVFPKGGDGAPTQHKTFDGEGIDDRLGRAVAGCDDMDGDGYGDLIVGAPQHDGPGGLSAGKVYVYSGASGGLLYPIDGENAGDLFGSAVACGGDVDGDGRADFAVGAPKFAGVGARSGRVYVYSGKTGAPLYSKDGEALGDEFGASLAVARDVDGDGKADLLVGAPRAAGAAGDSAGKAYLYSGVDGAFVRGWEGDQARAWLGVAVAGLGDFDGDGTPDLAVGAYLYDIDVKQDAGRAYVYSGATGAEVAHFDGENAGDNFATSLAGAGDVNKDGFADLLAGAPAYDRPGYFNTNVLAADSGAAYLFGGGGVGRLRLFEGESAGDRFGGSVAGGRDVDGDGAPDLDIGAALFGVSDGGKAYVYSGKTAALLNTGSAEFNGDSFGSAVVMLRDANGDDLADIAVGAEQYTGPGGAKSGKAYLFVGLDSPGDSDGDGAADPIDDCPTVFDPSQSDLDGDGLGDVCDRDLDGDGAIDNLDNCPYVANPGQENFDHDSIGDACDDDDDNDGMPDVWEQQHGLNPLDPSDGSKDPDHDFISNHDEYVHGTDPQAALDNDGDTMPDDWEKFWGVDNPNEDPDGDGASNQKESADGGDPFTPDRTSPVFKGSFDGGPSGHDFGKSFALSPDMNGNGRPDLIAIGDYNYIQGVQGRGRVFVYSGDDLAFLRTLDPTNTQGETDFGASLAALSDLGGDGKPDLLVGAPYYDGPGGSSHWDDGRVYFYTDFADTSVKTIESQSAKENFGRSIANVGDLDGDGKDDFVVGAPRAFNESGAVYGFSGATFTRIFALYGSGFYGWSVAAAGDVDQDGVPDFIVGATGYTPSTSLTFAGAFYVISGKTRSVIFSQSGAVKEGRLGRATAGVGDVDGDGWLDVAVAAPTEGGGCFNDYDCHGRGAVYVYSGKTHALIRSLSGPDKASNYGEAIIGPGDFDGDGLDDLVIGAPGTNTVEIRSGTLSALLRRLTGSSGALFGRGLGGSWTLPFSAGRYLFVGAPDAGSAKHGAAYAYVLAAPCVDHDADGYGSNDSLQCAHAGVDCNDADKAIHPSAPELCNAIDDNCNGQVDDGFGLGAACTNGVGACKQAGELVCSGDGSKAVCDAVAGSPSVEVCNGIDDNCDGATDEGFNLGAACANGVGACKQSGKLVCSGDGSASVCDAVAGAPSAEVCNGVDDDCNGAVDDGFNVGVACTDGVGACQRSGKLACSADGTKAVCDAVAGAPSAELCNGVDDDCDGTTDDGFDVGTACTNGVGACQRSGERVCSADGSKTFCEAVVGAPSAEICNGIDDNCNGAVDEGFNVGAACAEGVGACQRSGKSVCSADGSKATCDAVAGAPSAETCNGIDDDCDGTVDDGFNVGAACAEGVGACERSGKLVCSGDGSHSLCDAVAGTPSTEICNGVDDNCNGTVDEGFNVGAACNDGVGACERSGKLICAGDGSKSTCDAVAAAPAAEICNGLDDNCDGTVDEGFNVGAACTNGVGACQRSGQLVCSADGSTSACNAVAGAPGDEIECNGIDENCDGVDLGAEDFDGDGFSICDGDCDDTNPHVNPGAAEIGGNGVDDDCSPMTLDCTDADGDSFAAEGGVCGPVDCDDHNPNVHPGAVEIPYNGLDDDCIAASSDPSPEALLQLIVNGRSSFTVGIVIRGLDLRAGQG